MRRPNRCVRKLKARRSNGPHVRCHTCGATRLQGVGVEWFRVRYVCGRILEVSEVHNRIVRSALSIAQMGHKGPQIASEFVCDGILDFPEFRDDFIGHARISPVWPRANEDSAGGCAIQPNHGSRAGRQALR
jgi:hypothetical protein